MGAERIDDRGFERLRGRLSRGDTEGYVAECWVAKERIRDIYLTTNPAIAAERLDDAIDWCDDSPDVPELVTLTKTLKRWRTEILARHHTRASTGPVVAAVVLLVASRSHRTRHPWNLDRQEVTRLTEASPQQRTLTKHPLPASTRRAAIPACGS